MLPLIPHYILEKFESNQFRGDLEAACLFVDISGFTVMTETLTQYGQEGTEALANILYRLFDPLVQGVYERQGFICNFTGDGFIALFPCLSGEPGQLALYRALGVAYNIQQYGLRKPRFSSRYGVFELGIKTGLDCGHTEWGIIRPASDESRCIYYFRGDSIDGAGNAQGIAQSGEVLIGKKMFNQSRYLVSGERSGAYFRMTGLVNNPPEPISVQKYQPTPDAIAAFIVPELLDLPENLSQPGRGESRNVITVFLSLQDIFSHEHLEVFLDPFFRLHARYGGYLNKVEFNDKGCTILMFWGAPKSEENDLDRALNFTLDLKAASLLPFRAGVTYRILYAGFIGSDIRQEYSCYGRGVNLAARQMMAADWGELWLDDKVALLAEKRFMAKLQGYYSYKGFSEKLSTYKLIERLDSQQISFSQDEITGRQEELRRLEKFIKPIFSGEFAGVVSIYGEAGIGKSRLIEEFKKNDQDQLDSSLRWHSCPSDEIVRQSLNPFRHFLRGYFNQSQLKSIAQNRRDFDRKLDGLIGKITDVDLMRELNRTRSILAALVDLFWKKSLYDQLPPQSRFENMLDSLKHLFKAESLISPIIIELGDCHWFDVDSIQFVNYLIRNIEQYPIAIIAAFRLDREPDAFNPEVRQDAIKLTGFSEEDIIKFAEKILHDKVSVELAKELCERTVGNPFYIEQLLYYLRDMHLLGETDQGLVARDTEIMMPGSIRGTLISRLDRLSAQLKQAVQTASVLGSEFDVPILLHMMNGDPKLDSKIREGETDKIWHSVSQSRYLFKHALLRDAAYDMQLKSKRLHLHLLAARAYETVFQEELFGYYGEIAYHYDHAEISEKAIYYFNAAGEHARKNYQNEQALYYYDKLLLMLRACFPDEEKVPEKVPEKPEIEEPKDAFREMLDALKSSYRVDIEPTVTHPARHSASPHITKTDRQIMDALLTRSEILEYIGEWDQAIVSVKETYAIADQYHDESKLSTANGRLGWLFYLKGENQTAMVYYQEQRRLCKRTNDIKQMTSAIGNMGLIYLDHGNYNKALDCFSKTLRLSKEQKDKQELSTALMNMGKLFLGQKDFDQAMEYYEQAFILGVEVGDRLPVAHMFCHIGDIYTQTNDYAKAMRCYELNLKVCKEFGDKQGIARAYSGMGMVYSRLGKLKEALAFFNEHFQVSQELGDKRGIAQTAKYLGMIHIAKKEHKQAYHFLHIYLKRNQELDNQEGIADALACLGTMFDRQNNINNAMEYYQKSLKIFMRINDVKEITRLNENLGILLFKQSKYSRAIDFFRQAMRAAKKLKDPKKMNQLYALLGNCYRKSGDKNQAEAYYLKNFRYHQSKGQKKGAMKAALQLGHLYFESGREERAVAFFEALLRLTESASPSDQQDEKKHPHLDKTLPRLASLYDKAGNRLQQKNRLEEALDFYQKAIHILERLTDMKNLAPSYRSAGQVHEELGDYKNALVCYQTGLKLAKSSGSNQEIIEIQGNLGKLSARLNDYEKALKHYENQLDFSEKFGKAQDKILILEQIGSVYQMQEEYEKAISFYTRSFNFAKKSKKIVALCRLLGAIAHCFLQRGRFPQAIQYAKQQVAFSKRLNDDQSLIAGYGLVGELYFRMEKYEDAVFYYQKQVAHYQNGADPEQLKKLIHVWGDLGRAYYKLNQFQEATDCTKHQRLLSKELNEMKKTG
ncbi:MAG: hypothetical protein B6244_12020 [Candidatus Cloacimonetes bacterium 4572_55]|nr:MAG: hypothetical protein B6244_12020 [Candidatus Cloacimonetes bacterium 4572_55]